MRHSLLGVVVGTVLVVAVAAGRGSSEPAQLSPAAGVPYVSAGSLITHVATAESGPQVVTVIDSSQRVMAVYHVDKSTGEIALKSVRNLTWDLQMLEFNSREPLPQAIRDMRSELQH